MPFNGAGVFVPVALPGSFNPAVAGQDATPTDWNTLLADIAAGLTGTITNDGQSTVSADIPFGGHRLKNVGDPTADTDAVNRQSTWYIFDEQAVVAQPFVDFITIPATVKNLWLTFEMKPSSSVATFSLQTYGADGNIDTGATDYFWLVNAAISSSGTAAVSSLTEDRIRMSGFVDNGTDGVSGDARAFNIQAATRTKFNFQTQYIDGISGTAGVNLTGGGDRQEADRITGVRLLILAPATMTGTATLYASN